MPSIERRIVLTKGPPWGFRLYLDNNGFLTISKIRRHSPAETAKLHAGDQLLSLNGKLAQKMTHTEAVGIIDTTVGTLDLLISRFETTSSKVLMFDKAGSQPLANVQTRADVKLSPTKDQSPEGQEEVFVILENEDHNQEKAPQDKVDSTPVQENVVQDFQVAEERSVVVVPEPEEETLPVQLEQKPHEQPPPSPPVEIKPIPMGKLIKGYEVADHGLDLLPTKKHFGDSAFYDDPKNLYPTIEERIEMARRVATSLTAPDNSKSRGANIFERQRRRAEKHTIQNEPQVSPHPHENQFVSPTDLEHWPQLPRPMTPARDKSPSPVYRLGYTPGPPPAPPPPGPPPPPGLTRTLPEFLERAHQFPRSQHDNVTPALCHDIAAALHSSNSRGAQLFARKKNRSHKWEVSSASQSEQPVQVEPVMAAVPGPRVITLRRSSQPQQQPQQHQAGNRNTATNAYNNSYKSHQQQSQQQPTTANYNASAHGRTPSHVIQRSPGPPTTPAPLAAAAPAANKWKPVKFNVPQRA